MRMKREHMLRQRAVREYQRKIPYYINWFVLAEHQPDNLYDEPGERTWQGPYRLPILWIFDEEGTDVLSQTGRERIRMATFAVSVQALHRHGIEIESDDRMLDMIQWDGHDWDVQSVTYTSQTDMQSDPMNKVYAGTDDLTARVKAIRRFPDYDMPHETYPN